MSPDELARFRDMLLVRRRRLGEVHRTLYSQTDQNGQDSGRHSIDFGENAAAAHDADFSIACIETLEDELASIDEALERLVADRYGLCENCSGEVGTKRLERLPFAALCVGCQELQERGQI